MSETYATLARPQQQPTSPSLGGTLSNALLATHRAEVLAEELLAQLLGVSCPYGDTSDTPTMLDQAVELHASAVRTQESINRIREFLFGS